MGFSQQPRPLGFSQQPRPLRVSQRPTGQQRPLRPGAGGNEMAPGARLDPIRGEDHEALLPRDLPNGSNVNSRGNRDVICRMAQMSIPGGIATSRRQAAPPRGRAAPPAAVFFRLFRGAAVGITLRPTPPPPLQPHSPPSPKALNQTSFSALLLHMLVLQFAKHQLTTFASCVDIRDTLSPATRLTSTALRSRAAPSVARPRAPAASAPST